MELLLDDFVKTGSSEQEFFQLLDTVAEYTSLIPIDLSDCSILHYFREITKDKNGKPRPKAQSFFRLVPNDWNGQTSPIVNLDDEKLSKTLSPDLIKEMKTNKTAIFEETDKIVFLLSSMAVPTLLTKTGFGGDKATKNSLARDCYLASCMEDVKPLKALVRRTKSGRPKIFAFFSTKYSYMPQTVIKDIVQEISLLQQTEFKKWYFSNKLAECYLEFSQKAFEYKGEKWIPGVRICSSDTGYASTTIQSTWRNGDSILFFDVDNNKIRHYGEREFHAKVKQIVRNVVNSQDNFKKRIKELSARSISANSPQEMQDLFLTMFRSIAQKSEIDKVLGLKRMNHLLCRIGSERDWNTAHTMADIAITILKFPGEIDMESISMRDKLATGCGRALFVIN